jgi:hypothetical protein
VSNPAAVVVGMLLFTVLMRSAFQHKGSIEVDHYSPGKWLTIVALADKFGDRAIRRIINH